MIDYKADDKSLCASDFIQFVNCVWPGRYDPDKTQAALSKTLNITACDGRRLVGCLRILTDGCFFGTITEILVLPEYQGRGIGSRLLQLAKENAPTMPVSYTHLDVYKRQDLKNTPVCLGQLNWAIRFFVTVSFQPQQGCMRCV